MKRYLLAFLLIFSGITSYTQEKFLTLEDALVKNRTTLAPENLRQMQFIFGTEDFVYLKNIDGKDVWMKGNFKSTQDHVFLTLADLNSKLKASGKDTLTSMPPIQFNKSGDWIFSVRGNKLTYNAVSNTFSTLLDRNMLNKNNVEESNAGYVAYTDNFNLYVSKGGSPKQVTNDGSENIVYASAVHQQEFGIVKGTFWSNNGKKLAFYRMDQSMIPDYPIIDWSVRPAKVRNVKYPMSGDKSHHVTLGVYNAETEKLIYVKTGEPAEQFLTNIAWSPDDRFIYIAVLNRGQNHMKLNQYDAVSGEFIKTLFEEKSDKYVEPLEPIMFIKTDPSKFIWQSMRDGWNHIYLYDINGKLLRQLTSGQWEVVDVKGFDTKGENLYYLSTALSPLNKNLYQVNIKNGKTKLLTPGNSVHNAVVSNSGKYIVDNYSDETHARKINIIETTTGKIRTIFTATNPLSGFAPVKMKIFKLNNKNGTPLYCKLFTPVNFDSTKKYPVVVYWYGGPHAQLITNGFNGGSGDYWFQYMAQRGYVVFTIDVRGSDNRGMEFESSIFRNAGDAQMNDMMTAVTYLHSLSYVDRSNMGLFGWSYGGFLTTNFMLTHPGIFKAAVAGGPVIDWKYYEIMYTERYMDTPQENPEGFKNTDLTLKVDKLKGKLLLIHGLQDPVVLQQHSVRFVRAAIDKNVQVDYMIYPGHEHNVIGKDRVHLYQKVTDYLMEYLNRD